jgi:PAS domain S-box-containing protein
LIKMHSRTINKDNLLAAENWKAEEELSPSQKPTQELKEINDIIDCVGDILFVFDPNQRLIRVNKRTCEVLKKKPEELLGKHCYEVVHSTKEPWSNCPATKTFETNQICQGEIVDPSLGIPLLVTISPIFNEKGELTKCVHVAKDISDRVKAEEKLKESEEKYRASFESSMDALMLLDVKHFLDCNVSSLRMFGVSSVEEFTKYHPADFSPPTQPDGTPSMKAAMDHIRRALDNGSDHFFWIHKRIDETTFPADVLLTRIRCKGENALQATVRDITEQKEAEQKLKDNQERMAIMNEKLRVVGSITRHDIRNKLSTIPGYSYVMKKKLTDRPDLVEKLEKMEQSVKEVERILEFAKIYEQLGVEKLVDINVSRVVDDAAGMFSDLTFKVVNDCQGLTVLADSFLEQLIYNLIDNTRKYGKKTTIIRVHYEKAAQSDLNLIIEDDGAGIPLENKEQLFKRGFSTGGSTGFGLFLSKNMLEVYGWTIHENGEPGKGARFIIVIPNTNKNGQVNYQIKV